MSTRAQTTQTGPLPLGSTSNKVVKSDVLFDAVENMVRTESGGLTNVAQPTPWLLTAAGNVPTSGSANVSGPVYGVTRGVCHAIVGDKDVLLLHTGNEVWSFQGWSRSWRCIIGPSGASPLRIDSLHDLSVSEFPTQFAVTPTGIVIIPQGHRAYFYDGVKCMPLGYDRAPGPPIGLGPESTSDTWLQVSSSPWMGVNDAGYVLDGLTGHAPSEMYPAFRYGRIGTISTPGNANALATDPDEEAQIMGYLEPGRWTCRVQWIDAFGNLSPWSGTSNEIKVQRQPSMKLYEDSPFTTYIRQWTSPDCVQKQFAWDGIQAGPTGTIARNLARTKDLVNSGTAKHFELPLDSSINLSALATLPDNSSDFYPDNIPDSWLLNEIVEYDPVPQFRLAAIAFGRLWVANWPGGEGSVRASLVGRYGTFRRDDPFLIPDPAGGAVTGLHATQRGLLIFTATGSFLLSSATGLPQDVSKTIGCVAPSSIATLRNGMTVWLGRDGFFGWDGSGDPKFLWEDHRRDALEINQAMAPKAVAVFDPISGEYRCWLPCRGGTENNRCWTFDGAEWHYRTDLRATGVCVTKDHRSYVIACGERDTDGKDGVWALDRDGEQESIMVRTGWIRSQRLGEKASVRRGYLLLRETGVPNNDGQRIAIAARTNYRVDTVSTTYVTTYPNVSATARQQPLVGVYSQDGTSTWGDGKPWRIRRVYRAKFDLDLPSCDVFQLEFTCDRRVEILGVTFEEQDRPTHGAANVR